MVLTVLIALELVVSFAALAVLGTEPADRAKIFGRAEPAEERGAPLRARIVALAAPLKATRRTVVYGQTARRRSAQRVMRAPAPPTRRPSAPLPAWRTGAARTAASPSWRAAPAPQTLPVPVQSDTNVIPLRRADPAAQAKRRAANLSASDPAAN